MRVISATVCPAKKLKTIMQPITDTPPQFSVVKVVNTGLHILVCLPDTVPVTLNLLSGWFQTYHFNPDNSHVAPSCWSFSFGFPALVSVLDVAGDEDEVVLDVGRDWDDKDAFWFTYFNRREGTRSTYKIEGQGSVDANWTFVPCIANTHATGFRIDIRPRFISPFLKLCIKYEDKFHLRISSSAIKVYIGVEFSNDPPRSAAYDIVSVPLGDERKVYILTLIAEDVQCFLRATEISQLMIVMTSHPASECQADPRPVIILSVNEFAWFTFSVSSFCLFEQPASDVI